MDIIIVVYMVYLTYCIGYKLMKESSLNIEDVY